MEDRTGRAAAHVVTAAWLYYHQDQTQQQIAKRLGVSRATVVRLLQTAREDGLVEIRVTQPLPEPMAAALELEELLLGNSKKNEESIRTSLLEYCKQDTWAMVELYWKLSELAKLEAA